MFWLTVLANLSILKFIVKIYGRTPTEPLLLFSQSLCTPYGRLVDTANPHILWEGTYLKNTVTEIMQNMLYAYIHLCWLLNLKNQFFRNARHLLILASSRALLKSFCLHAAYCNRDICVPFYESQYHWSVSFCALWGWTSLNSADDIYHTQKASHPCAHVYGSRICLYNNKKKSVIINCNRYHLQYTHLGFVL